MTLRLNGSTSGYVEIDAPAAAGSNTLVLPTGNGSSGQYLQTNGSGTLSWSTSGLPAQVLTLGTSVASTSGTSIDFTSIPSTVKRITVMFRGVSTSSTSSYLIRLGAGSVETTSYASTSMAIISSPSYGSASNTTGFLLTATGPEAAALHHGSAILTLMGSNIWTLQSSISAALSDRCFCSSGSIALSGTLDRVRITTVNGTDTFDAGTINIMYEG